MVETRLRRSSWLLSLSLSVFLLSCSAKTVIVRKDEPRPQESVHLVIDLGSSGTRFCLYGVKSLPGQGCALTPLKPICSRVPGGLARLTQGHRVSHVADLVDPPLQHGWSLLGRSKLRGEVRAATALGTGGFRDRVTGQPVERPEWQAAFTEVERFLRREAGLSTVSARPITGQEEGRLAWFGLAQSDGMPEEFAAIEAGGATIQLAVGQKGAPPAEIEVATDPQGQDVVFDRLFTSDRVLSRSFQACYNPRHPRRQDGLKCIELLSREAFRSSAVRRLAEKTSARRLYGLGLSYADLFRSYPAAPPWPPSMFSHSSASWPCSRRRAMFSRTTIESSTTMPVANAKPPSDMTLRLTFACPMKKNVVTSEIGRLSEIMNVLHESARKKKIMRIASTPPTIASSRT